MDERQELMSDLMNLVYSCSAESFDGSRVFVKDGVSRDHGLHSRDHLPSPNHSTTHNTGFDSDQFY